jgi:hypothetical protein
VPKEGVIQSMPTDTPLKKFADTVAKPGKKIAVPQDALARELAERERMNKLGLQALGLAQPVPAPTPVNTFKPVPQDKVQPNAKFGSRPGELRINVDEMLTPLGSAVPEKEYVKTPLGTVRKYKLGTPLVDEDQLALLHEGEAVIPADENPANTEALGVVGDTGQQAQSVPVPQEQPLNTFSLGKVESAAPQEDQLVLQRDPNTLTGSTRLSRADKNGGPEPGLGSVMRPSLTSPQYMPGNGPNVPAPDPMEIIRGDKENAMRKGDLVGLGSALINEKQLVPTYAGPNVKDTSAPAPGQPISDKVLPQDQFRYQEQKFKQDILSGLSAGTPEGEAKAGYARQALEELRAQNPWGSEANHPGVLGKIGHVLGTIGNVAGETLAPGLIEAIPGSRAKREMDSALGRVEVNDAAQNAARTAKADVSDKYELKPVVDRREGSPTFGKNVYAGVNRTDPSDIRYVGAEVPEAPGAQKAAPLTSETSRPYVEMLHAVPLDVVKQVPDKFKGETVGQKLDRLEKSFVGMTPEQAKESITNLRSTGEWAATPERQIAAEGRKEDRQISKEQRTQETKDRNTKGYAEDGNGETIFTNRYEAEQKGYPFQEMKPGDMGKDRQALRQLTDVQKNSSRYTKAARDYKDALASGKRTEGDRIDDGERISKLMTETGMSEISASLAAGGHITVPMLTTMGEAYSKALKSGWYHDLTPQGKDVWDGYLRTLAAVPAYQKALTGIGRTNKEMLDLELANIASPAVMRMDDILRRQANFQENIDQASAGFPKLPGLKTPKQVRDEEEGTRGSSNVPSEGNAKYHLSGKAGEIFSNDGKTWFDSNGKPVSKGQ